MRRLVLWVAAAVACARPVPPVDTDESDAVDSDGTWAPLPLPAAATCTAGDATTAPTFDPGIVATYRKDVFYPYGPGALAEDKSTVFGTADAPAYPEAQIPDPIDGGRFQIVATSAVTGRLLPASVLAAAADEPASVVDIRKAFEVQIDGVSATTLLDDLALDWVRVWPVDVVAGEPVWIAFHSRDPKWDRVASARIVVPTDAGDAVAGAFNVQRADVLVTSVQPSEGLDRAWVHLRNAADGPRTVSRVVVDGRDLTAAACLADPVLDPGETALVEVPLPAPWTLSAAWTVVVELADGPPTAAAGRVLRPFFPIHTWPTSRDCPLPGVNDAGFQRHADAGYDTFFARGRYRTDDGCADVDTADVLATRFREEGVYAMADEGFVVPADARDRVPARLIGDEVDDKSKDTLTTRQKMRQKAEETTHYALAEPEIGVYIGGSRHRFTGMFAGSTDIQGMDFYVDGCAPHITEFGAHPPLRGAYDYLRATRDNHLPNPTWLYTQGFSGAWRGVKPGPTGATVQTWSVIAAGGKGVMTFQTTLADADARPDTWAALTSANRSIRLLRPWLRTGDPTDAATTADDAIVEALRVPGGLVLVVIGLASDDGPDELECLGPIYQEWVLSPQDVAVDITVPDDVGVTGWFEVVDGAAVRPTDVEPPRVTAGRGLSMPRIPVDDARPVRVFVLHDGPALADALGAP